MKYYESLEDARIETKRDNFYQLILETTIKSLEEHIQLAG